MKKVEIHFPDPVMRKMKSVAKKIDIPVSEVLRISVENQLERYPDGFEEGKLEVPVVNAGKCLLPTDRIRDAIYE